jgi:putative endonuclease
MQEVVGSTPILSTKAHISEPFLFMAFTVYIIYSLSLNQFYIGHTQNLPDRLYRHNNSGSKTTKKTNDWILKHTETFLTKAESVRRELEIKSRKSRKYIEELISPAGQSVPQGCGKVVPMAIGVLPQRHTREPLCLQ